MFNPHFQLNIAQRFGLAMLLIGVLPLLMAGFVSYITARDALLDEVLTQQQQLLVNYEEQLSLIQDQAESMVAGIAGIETVTDALHQSPENITSYQQLATQAQVGYILNGYLNVKGLVAIHIYGEGGIHFQVGDTLNNREEPGIRERLLMLVQNEDSWVIWPGVMPNVNASSPERLVLPAVKGLYAFDRKMLERRRIGLVVVTFSVELLSGRFASSGQAVAQQLYLLDQHDQYIVHPEPEMIGKRAKPDFFQALHQGGGDPVELDGRLFYMTRQPVKRLGWNFFSATPRAMVHKEISLIGSVNFLVFSLALVVVSVVALNFSREVVSPIRHVTDAFKRLKAGQTDVEKLPVSGNDEVSQLAQWFNLFLDELKKNQASEEALRISEERYELVARATDEGIWDMNRESDTIYFSDRLREIIGRGADMNSLSRFAFFKLVHPEDRRPLLQDYRRFLSSDASSISMELRIVRTDGSFLFVRNNCRAIRNEQGEVVRMVGSLQDISPQKRIEYRLRHDASHDPLTGLYNRAWMLKRIEREMEISHSEGDKHYAVLFIDLDDFKTLNDTLGHSYGDLLLVETAKRMEACLRPGDALARLGGDEFIVLLIGIDMADVVRVAERLVEEIAVPCQLQGHEHRTRASIGVAFSKSGYWNAEEILRDADTAMYRAKSRGKGQYVIFDQHMREVLLQRATIEHELADALERQQLQMHYQPIRALDSQKIGGFEALLRWNHPTRKMSPGEFIPAAEESALIHRLGDWVIAQVLGHLSAWQAQFALPVDFRVAINISPKQFGDPRLLDRISRHIADTEIDPAHVAIELTETAIFSDKVRVMEYLHQLRAMKISISLDDFGTGYSSLSHLNSFPIDTIKIDRSFITTLSPGNRQARLVNTMIVLARELGVEVVAEGVESKALLDYLSEKSCDFAQGYFISHPVPFQQATRLLAAAYPKVHSKEA